jgi:hypothetical protein
MMIPQSKNPNGKRRDRDFNSGPTHINNNQFVWGDLAAAKALYQAP